MDGDLFSVFTEAPQAVEPKVKEKKKDERRGNVPAIAKVDAPKRKSGQENDLKSTQKKSKTSTKAEAPVVTDSFETEAMRKVNASSGLQGDGSEASDEKVSLQHRIRHEVALPPNYDYKPISEHKSTDPARTYPFKLDDFQAVAIASIERNESVLVSAHTSAGKTVVAEYAIAQSLRAKQRVIYTSPIKALSNQKYRELREEFSDVGLMTGDVTMNPDASCLVMTTEILRSMLYRGSEVMREVAWVIFDEVHYMRDKERGVVWEETIILLPDNVHYVFLSATIPNAMEFAQWICKTHNQPCHVVYTNFRPTPLQHYLFPSHGSGIYMVVDEKSNFREDNFQKAMGSLGAKMGDDPGQLVKTGKNNKINKGKDNGGGSDIYKIIRMIIMRNYNPVIVFSFSKRECERLAMIISKLNLNTEDEHANVEQVFNSAMDKLSEEDRGLPQVKQILPLLKRGIGLHHSGLLPILKEVIELLFQSGLIKVLFATETFSIGLNMPAKTVVFTSVRKWDGREFRWVSGGEYIQMSGRAGRRGLDDRGVVIMMIDEQMEPAVAKGMVKGEADRLESAFRLSYNMIINLLRVEGISPEFMLERSFFQFQNGSKATEMEAEIEQLEQEYSEATVEDEENIAEYYNHRKQIDSYGEDMRVILTHPSNCSRFLQSGRLIKVRVKRQGKSDLDFGWGVVINMMKRSPPKNSKKKVEWSDHEKFVVDVLVNLAGTSPVNLIRRQDPNLVEGIKPAVAGESARAEILPITLESITQFANIRAFVPKDLTSVQARNAAYKSVEEISRRFPDGIPSLDPVKNMNIKDDAFLKIVRKVEILESVLAGNPLRESERLPEIYEQYAQKVALAEKIKTLKSKLSKAYSILQLDELKCRMRVLRRLGFISQSDIVEIKGRVACEISSGDELLLTELIFNGTFSKLTPEQCASLLSCFVLDEASKEQTALRAELKEPLSALQLMAKEIAKVSRESKIELNEEEYVKSFKTELMEVVYQWAKGASFAQICKMTDIYEGSLIRVFRRLEELIRQLVVAAQRIGNEELEEKMEASSKLISRDLVSAGSLYLEAER